MQRDNDLKYKVQQTKKQGTKKIRLISYSGVNDAMHRDILSYFIFLHFFGPGVRARAYQFNFKFVESFHMY